MTLELWIDDKPVKRMLQNAQRKIPGLMWQARVETAKEIYDESQRLVPVKTGYLKSSGTYGPGTVQYNAPYAGYVEYGTSKMQGRYFLTRAFFAAFAKLPAKLRAMADEILRG